MVIAFNAVLEKSRDCFQQGQLPTSLMPYLQAITIIRDVYGKIRVFLEPKNGTEIKKAELDELAGFLLAGLGNYYANNADAIWVPDPRKDAFRALHQQVIEQRVRAPWDTGDTPRWYILERHIAKQIWTSRTEGAPPWKSDLVINGHRPAIVTFFSFKGGGGRTSTLAGAALTLARHGHRVAMVDLDLEAPGLASLFFHDTSANDGVVDYLLEKPIHGSDWKIRPHILSINEQALLGDMGQTLRVLPAGSVDEQYLEKLARLDFQHIVNKEIAENLSKMLKEIEATTNGLDFLFLDARAGFHDIGGLAMAHLSHAAVIFGTHTRQTWAGLTRVVARLAQSEATDPLPVLLVHAMAPPLSTPGRERELALFRTQAYDIFKEHYYADTDAIPNDNDPDAPFTPIVIPWQDSLRGDLALFARDSSPDEVRRLSDVIMTMTTRPYQELAERVCRLFGRKLLRQATEKS